jgi:nucleoid-associated protein YgaU
MGLFDFIKDAGEKVFGKDEDPKEAAAELAAAKAKKAAVEARRVQTLTKYVGRLGLEIDDLGIAVDGDVVVVSGTVATQEVKEKIVLALGNTAGTARVDDRITVEVEEPEATFHTVVSGDSLSKIAKKYYGDPMKYTVIFEANKPMLSDPDKIYPGQVLRIPPVA